MVPVPEGIDVVIEDATLTVTCSYLHMPKWPHASGYYTLEVSNMNAETVTLSPSCSSDIVLIDPSSSCTTPLPAQRSHGI